MRIFPRSGASGILCGSVLTLVAVGFLSHCAAPARLAVRTPSYADLLPISREPVAALQRISVCQEGSGFRIVVSFIDADGNPTAVSGTLRCRIEKRSLDMVEIGAMVRNKTPYPTLGAFGYPIDPSMLARDFERDAIQGRWSPGSYSFWVPWSMALQTAEVHRRYTQLPVRVHVELTDGDRVHHAASECLMTDIRSWDGVLRPVAAPFVAAHGDSSK